MTTAALVTDPADHPVIDAPWWHRQADICRRDGYPDLEAICQEHAAALEYGGFVDLEEPYRLERDEVADDEAATAWLDASADEHGAPVWGRTGPSSVKSTGRHLRWLRERHDAAWRARGGRP